MLQAVRERGLEDRVKLVAFDEDEQTLQGIKDGHIHATVVQNPYLFGYESVRMLQHLARYGSLPKPGRWVRRVGDHFFVKHRIIKKQKDGPLFDEDVYRFHEDLRRKKQ